MTLATILMRLRKRMTMTEIGAYVGVNARTVARWCEGVSKPHRIFFNGLKYLYEQVWEKKQPPKPLLTQPIPQDHQPGQ